VMTIIKETPKIDTVDQAIEFLGRVSDGKTWELHKLNDIREVLNQSQAD
jgi:hypothetical protein